MLSKNTNPQLKINAEELLLGLMLMITLTSCKLTTENASQPQLGDRHNLICRENN